MKLVDKSLDIPLHIQLSQIIKEMIETEELQPGHYLMPEREICQLQGISRMTVNKAILNLVNEGLLERKQGKGTFVAHPRKKQRYQNLEGFTQIARKHGMSTKTRLVHFELGTRSKKVQAKLRLDDLMGYKIKRVRLIDDEPVILETVYLNPKLCEGLNEQLIRENSLYELYKTTYHHKIVRAEQIIKPVLITKEEADLLEQPINTLALRIDRIVYTDKDEIMEYTVSIFMSNKHDFEVVLQQD